MPYSITTKDGITIQNIPDDVPADAPQLRERVAKIRASMPKEPKAPEAMNPTDGMSTTDKVLAGVGKGMTDTARGVGQLFGLVSREDVAKARERDKALMDTTAGTVGNVAGNIAMLAPTAFIPGAATMRGAAMIGAGTGLAAPSTSTSETLQNTAIGGAVAPAAIGVGRAIGAGVQAGRSLMEPFTKKGQDAIAARTLQSFATDPAKAAANLRNAAPIVPGSNPTMAQAAQDPGLAQMERTLRNNPETGGALAEMLAAQRSARLGAVQNMAGTGATRDAAVAARSAATEPLYQQATSAAYFVDANLAGLMKRPVMQSAMQRAQRLANNQGRTVQLAADTAAPFAGVGGSKAVTRQSITGQGLQDLKMALDDMLSDPMAGIGKNEASSVKNIRGQLIDWMEQANPAFKQARDTFSQKSMPINTMDVSSDLLGRMQSPLGRAGASTREMKNEYARALEQAMDSTKRQIGIDLPLDRVMNPQDIAKLQAVAKDMARAANAEDMGRAVGSNTAQNLAAQNLLRRTLGPTGLPQSWAESNALQALLAPYTGLTKLSGSENAVMNRLLHASMNPADANALLMMAQQPAKGSALGVNALRYLPGVAASVGNSP